MSPQKRRQNPPKKRSRLVHEEFNEAAPASSPTGFRSRDDQDAPGARRSKAGRTHGATDNALASSADVSHAPDSTSTGEDSEPTTAAPRLAGPAVRKKQTDFDTHSAEPDEEEMYGTESDELEFGSAYLEDATQSPGLRHDPSAAYDEVEDADDTSDFDREEKV